jgi:predicted SprT family Zn-dependent metalloprotease
MIKEILENLTLKDFKKKYNDFNKKYFDNKLPDDLEINFRLRKKYVFGEARCEIISLTKEIKHLEIRLNPIIRNFDKEYAEGILLHEMIHIYQYITNTYNEANPHGFSFLKIRKEIMKKGSPYIPTKENKFEKDNIKFVAFIEMPKTEYVSFFYMDIDNEKLKQELLNQLKKLKSMYKNTNVYYGKLNLDDYPFLLSQKISKNKLIKNIILKEDFETLKDKLKILI